MRIDGDDAAADRELIQVHRVSFRRTYVDLRSRSSTATGAVRIGPCAALRRATAYVVRDSFGRRRRPGARRSSGRINRERLRRRRDEGAERFAYETVIDPDALRRARGARDRAAKISTGPLSPSPSATGRV